MTTPAPTPVNFPPPPVCTACGSARSDPDSPSCAECGHDVFADRPNWQRWEMFLIFTRRLVVGRWAILGLWAGSNLVALAIGNDLEQLVPSVIVAGMFVFWGLGATAFSRRGVRGRTLRRAWMLSAGFGTGLWAVLTMVLVIVITLAQFFITSVPGGLVGGSGEEGQVQRLCLSIGLGGIIGLAGAWMAFKGTLKLTHLSPTLVERKAMRTAIALTILPIMAVVAVSAIGVAQVLRKGLWG